MVILDSRESEPSMSVSSQKIQPITDAQIGQLLIESYREILELRRLRLASKEKDKAISESKPNR